MTKDKGPQSTPLAKETLDDWLRENNPSGGEIAIPWRFVKFADPPAPVPDWAPPPEPGWATEVRPPSQDLPAPWEPFAGAITADREVVFWRRRLSGGA